MRVDPSSYQLFFAPTILLGRRWQLAIGFAVRHSDPCFARACEDRLLVRATGSKWLEPLPPLSIWLAISIHRLALCNSRPVDAAFPKEPDSGWGRSLVVDDLWRDPEALAL